MRFDDKAMFSGFLTGLIIGGGFTLFKGPRLNLNRTGKKLATKAGESMRELLSDPIAESIEEGKEAARKRRSELGLTTIKNA